jgi:hypothetical protein
LASYPEGTITNNAGGTVINSGTLGTYPGGMLNNSGTITNSGTVANSGTLNNNAGATLNNSGTATNNGTVTNNGNIIGTGTYTQTAGLTTNNGSLSQASVNIQGGIFSQQVGALTATSIMNGGTINYSGGTIAGALQNTGQVNVTGGTFAAPNIFWASVMNNSGGNFTVGNGVSSAYLIFASLVTNNAGATFTINNSYVTFADTFLNNGTLVSDPSTIIFDGIFTGGGTIAGSAGDKWEFLGAGANTINLGGKAIDIGTLILGPGVTLSITDGTLTVNTLIDPTGSDYGITGSLIAGSYGTLGAVPIPGAILLLAPGLACLVSLRRRIVG